MRALKPLAAFVVLLMTCVPAHAATAGTAQVLSDPAPVFAPDAPQRRAVEQQLIDSGVDPAESRRRVERMTDAEVATLHARLNNLPAGGRIGTTNLLLIIIILILIL